MPYQDYHKALGQGHRRSESGQQARVLRRLSSANTLFAGWMGREQTSKVAADLMMSADLMMPAD